MSAMLEPTNIITNCTLNNKHQIIEALGARLQASGYCTPAYATAMLEKEKVFNTYIGNYVAIPHGIESARNEVITTGLVIMTFPQGVDWGGGNKAKLVVGLAARDNEQVEMLSKIAIACMEPENVERIVASQPDKIIKMLDFA